MNRCDATRRRLDDWLDDALSGEELSAVESHLTECPACAETFRRHARIADDLAALGRAAERIAARPAPTVVQPVRGRLATLARIAAAIAFACLAGYGVYVWQAGLSAERLLVDATDSQGQPVSMDATQVNPRSASPSFSIEAPAGMTAVRLESSRPEIHIVWLYDQPGEAAPETAPPDEPSGLNDNPQGVLLCSARS